jgi:hypothetical protein
MTTTSVMLVTVALAALGYRMQVSATENMQDGTAVESSQA